MSKFSLLILLFTFNYAFAQKAYLSEDDAKPIKRTYITTQPLDDLYGPTLVNIKWTTQAALNLLAKHAPTLKLPPTLKITTTPYKAFSISFEADQVKNDGSGLMLIYETLVNTPNLELIGIHEAIHAVLQANWGTVNQGNLNRMAIEELLADLYPLLIHPGNSILREERSSRQFHTITGFTSSHTFTKKMATEITGNDDYFIPFDNSKPKGNDDNNCHHILGGVRRFLNIKALEALPTEQKIKYFAELVQFFKTEILDQWDSLKIQTAYDFNLVIIKKLEQRKLSNCNSLLK